MVEEDIRQSVAVLERAVRRLWSISSSPFPVRETKPFNNVESCLLQEEICGGGGFTRKPTWIFSKTPDTAGGPGLHPEAVPGEAEVPRRPRGLPTSLRPHQQPAEENPP
ncbi:Hypothetical predicted protein [Xyrichtys novacula]|uniref:Uncharacterized protein n=1 Tax=Xyrichtys novacula TaxID=13765 RepID=A0AAV1GQ67_XYRNO|nr:Hypothetical predicted protein [Xyrichtys novacula]